LGSDVPKKKKKINKKGIAANKDGGSALSYLKNEVKVNFSWI
jgi:hypothetical protein